VKVDRLSISSARMFARWGEQYRFKREVGPMAPGIALVRGKGLDAAANLNNEQKAKTRIDLPLEEIEAAAADSVEASFHGQVMLTPDERQLGAQAVKDDTKDRAVRLARRYRDAVAPRIQPGLLPNGEPAVQAAVSASLPAIGLELYGVMDLQDEARVIRDLKSSGKSPNRDAAEKSSQLSMYGLLDHILTGAPTSRLALDTVVLTDGGKCYAADAQETTRGPEEHVAMIERLGTIKNAIEREIFVPTDPDNWACSPRFCGYYEQCRYTQRGASRPQS